MKSRSVPAKDWWSRSGAGQQPARFGHGAGPVLARPRLAAVRASLVGMHPVLWVPGVRAAIEADDWMDAVHAMLGFEEATGTAPDCLRSTAAFAPERLADVSRA